MTAVAPPPVISAGAVVRRYRNGRGVGPLDLTVAAGQCVALMGRNGSGKTTLLRLLATVSRPQQGAVSWFGGDARAARHRIGLALDGALEDPSLTGRQATHFWCAQWIDDSVAMSARADAMLHRLGLEGAADEPVATYSFGMRRRLALTAALAHEPALALLDEPTAGLDPEGIGLLTAVIAERSARGHSTVIASNDAAFVEAAADHVAFLDAGLVVRAGSPRDLIADLPPGRVGELVVDGAPPIAALRAVAGVVEVAMIAGVLTVRFDGDHVTAAIAAAADTPAGRLREMRLRRPGLADCFREVTGHTLEEQR